MTSRKLPSKRSNGWDFLDSFFSKLIDRGQFSILCIFVIMLVAVIKMKPENIFQLLKSAANWSTTKFILGYILWIFTLILWLTHAKAMRKRHYEEISRIAKERNEAQEAALGKKLIKSSGE